VTHPTTGARTLQPAGSPLLAGLTSEQAQAVQHGPGPLLLIAGPGAGKTKTLTHRVAHLLATGLARQRESPFACRERSARRRRERLDLALSPNSRSRSIAGRRDAPGPSGRGRRGSRVPTRHRRRGPRRQDVLARLVLARNRTACVGALRAERVGCSSPPRGGCQASVAHLSDARLPRTPAAC
jgi:AAA domain